MKTLGAVFLVVAALSAPLSFAGTGSASSAGTSIKSQSVAAPSVLAGDNSSAKATPNPIRVSDHAKDLFGSGSLSVGVFCSSFR